MSRIREENRKLRSDYEELTLRYDDEMYSGSTWKKEKERLETKIQDVTKAYESSTAAQNEQQSQIVALHSQVRELRSVLNDAETDRALLQKARRALQAELDSLKLENIDTSKIAGDAEMQKLRLEKQDLERSVEEQSDRVGMALERMKKAETYATECQVELGKTRVENSELEKRNVGPCVLLTSNSGLIFCRQILRNRSRSSTFASWIWRPSPSIRRVLRPRRPEGSRAGSRS